MMKLSPSNQSELQKKNDGFFPSKQSELEKQEGAQELTTQRREEETADLVLGRHAAIPTHYLSYPVLGGAVVVATVFAGLIVYSFYCILNNSFYCIF